jgi:tetratricopeptide (TPR) repeat protein
MIDDSLLQQAAESAKKGVVHHIKRFLAGTADEVVGAAVWALLARLSSSLFKGHGYQPEVVEKARELFKEGKTEEAERLIIESNFFGIGYGDEANELAAIVWAIQFYADCGELDKAQRLVDQLASLDASTLDHLRMVIAKFGNVEEAGKALVKLGQLDNAAQSISKIVGIHKDPAEHPARVLLTEISEAVSHVAQESRDNRQAIRQRLEAKRARRRARHRTDENEAEESEEEEGRKASRTKTEGRIRRGAKKMNETIRAFVAAMELIAGFVELNIVDPLWVRGEMAWEDFEEWLDEHDLTIPGLVGLFGRAAFGLIAISLWLLFWAITAGELQQQRSFEWSYFVAGLSTLVVIGFCITLMRRAAVPATRVLFGLVIAVIFCLFVAAAVVNGDNDPFTLPRAMTIASALFALMSILPIAVLFWTARSIFDLLFRTGEAGAELISAAANDIPYRLRQQLEAVRERSWFPVDPRILLVIFVVSYLFLFMYPSFTALGILAWFGAGLLVVTKLGEKFGIKGHAFKHLMFAVSTTIFLISFPVWVLIQQIQKPDFIGRTGLGQAMWQIRLNEWQYPVILAVTALAAFLLFRTTRSHDSDHDHDEGDVIRPKYKTKVGALTQDGKPVYVLDTGRDWTWLKNTSKNKWFWIVLGSISAMALLIFSGAANAVASIWATTRTEDVFLALGVGAVITGLVYSFVVKAKA